MAWDRVTARLQFRRLGIALSAFIGTVFFGGVALWALGDGKYTLFDTIYFTLISAGTVGYGELPHMEDHTAMRVVTGALIVLGLGTIAFFQSTLTALFVEGVVGESFRRRRMHKKIEQLEGHLVVAGCGRTGRYIIEELVAIRRDFVVIDKSEAVLKRLNDELGGGILYVVGDATEDHTLLEARVKTAFGVMAALTDDRDNLFIVLSTRALNPGARIVAKVVELENESKMHRAGADQTVSPHRMGGLRMVSELVRPRVTNFLDQLRIAKDLHFEEVELPARSRYVGHTLREVPVRAETQLLVVALHEPGGHYVYNPSPDHALVAGSSLIVMGDLVGIEKLRALVSRKA